MRAFYINVFLFETKGSIDNNKFTTYLYYFLLEGLNSHITKRHINRIKLMRSKYFNIILLGSVMFSYSLMAQENKTGKFIDPSNMDLSVKPGNDFYMYSNGTWIRNNP